MSWLRLVRLDSRCSDLRPIAEKVGALYAMNVEIADSYRNTQQKRWNSTEILRQLKRNKLAGSIEVGLTSVDIYSAGLTYVFGEAEIGGDVAVVSEYRFKSAPECVEKLVVHELGHVFGLEHCHHKCVMRLSRTVKDVIDKPHYYCADCAQAVAEYLVQRDISAKIGSWSETG